MTLRQILSAAVVIFAIIAGTYGAVCTFATNERVDEIEMRVDGISMAYLQEELDRLEDKYGHTDCSKMTEGDKNQCRWVKKTLKMLGAK